MSTLGVFAKFWEPGKVKTRLAEDLGTHAAARIYQAMLGCLLARMDDCGSRRWLYVSPVERLPEFRALAGPAWNLARQASGDLGVRMATFFAERLRPDAPVVLLGSDSPDLPREYLDEAFRLLRDHDVVLGPADDGGYYLVGCSREVPQMFAGIAWSTPEVWRQTLERLDSVEARWAQLPAWRDVDTLDDLKQLKLDLEAAAAKPADPALEDLGGEIGAVLGGEGAMRSRKKFPGFFKPEI